MSIHQTTKTSRRTAKSQKQTRFAKSVAKNHPLKDYAYVLDDDRPRYILVPVEEYDRLIEFSMADSVLRKLKDIDNPNVKWVDLDDAKLQYAGQQIAAARKAAGLTQKQLAQKLKMPQSQISRIERNPDHTTVRTLKRIAKALKVDVRELVK
jgi:DNA-binding XRE family transcriptional regulator